MFCNAVSTFVVYQDFHSTINVQVKQKIASPALSLIK